MVVKDEIADIISEYGLCDCEKCKEGAKQAADEIITYIQNTIVNHFSPNGQWRKGNLHKSTAHEIVEAIINKGEALHGK